MDYYDRDCDHDFVTLTCDICGLYQGQECVHCHEYSDGGDFLASRASWCECDDIAESQRVIRQ